MGELMKCAKCGKEQKSDPRVESNWWCITYQGVRFYFCPECFHPADKENAYEIMKFVIERTKKSGEQDDIKRQLLEEIKELREKIGKIEDPKKREEALIYLNRVQQDMIEPRGAKDGR